MKTMASRKSLWVLLLIVIIWVSFTVFRNPPKVGFLSPFLLYWMLCANVTSSTGCCKSQENVSCKDPQVAMEMGCAQYGLPCSVSEPT